jgi:hypothetical protein
MPLEILQSILEVAAHHNRVTPGYPLSPRKRVIVADYLSRILISLPVFVLLVAGLIIFIEGFPILTPISLVSSAVFTLVNIVILYLLWRHPYFVSKILIYVGILIILVSIIVFLSVMQTKNDSLRGELIWSFIMIIPFSLILFLCILAGRRDICRAKYASWYSDEIGDDDQITDENGKNDSTPK